MISAKDINILRSIARAGEDYDTIKRLISETGWEIDEDETTLGFLRIYIPDMVDKYYRLIVGYRDPDRPPYSLLSFYIFPGSEEQIPGFNTAFQQTAKILAGRFGPPALTGDHRLSFRTWSYMYQRWSLPEGEFTLIQDEFDIQEGLDITLWVQPVGTPIEETAHL
ncbi:MAG: hypothetical protein C5B50_04930 [Verrucomicrobia bacterium]|nr:MAG: hypothetical protein C5B50_04930 [Verrucomicrobiota bacterium]